MILLGLGRINMWKYEKKLQYPVNIKNKDLRMAKCLLAQYGGPDGEFAAAMRYLNQRYSMPDERGYALLNDIGTEEMAHVEMIATMVTQLVKPFLYHQALYIFDLNIEDKQLTQNLDHHIDSLNILPSLNLYF